MYNNKKTEYEAPTVTICSLAVLDVITVSDPALQDVDWELENTV